MNFTSIVALSILGLAAALGVWRVLRRGSLGDRAMAFDLLASIVTCGVLVAAAGIGDGILLDLAVLLGLIGFLTSVTVARYVESRSKDEA